MRMFDIAQICIKLKVSNHYTATQLAHIATTFDTRAAIDSIDDIDVDALIRFKEETLKAVQPVTYNGYLKHLRMLGAFGATHGFLQKNWFQLLSMVPEPEKRPKTVNMAELKKILNFLDENQSRFSPHWFWSTAIRFLYHTGMRRRQLVMLDWKDINFSKKTILCSSRGSKTNREWTIPLDQRLAPYLHQYRSLCEIYSEKKLTSDDPVFNICMLNERYVPNKLHPGRMQPEHFTGGFKRLRNAVGIKEFSPHRMRHTTATALCNPEDGSRPDIFTAQRILGHTAITTTRGYVQTSTRRMKSELASIPDL